MSDTLLQHYNTDAEHFFDVLVVGAGPAGLTAALYLGRANYRVLVLEQESIGGQIRLTEEIVNYPGVFHASGEELTRTMRKQAERFGAEFCLAKVQEIDCEAKVKKLVTDRGTFYAYGLVLALGASPRMIGFPGEAQYRGRGVAYCATCDGEFFTGKDVLVVGAGFAAAEESVFLTRYARSVTVVAREPEFTCAAAVADEALNCPKVKVLFNTEVEEVGGDSSLRWARLRNNVTGEIQEVRPQDPSELGVFVFAGYAPATELVKGTVELDQGGYIVTDRMQKTSVDGVYAAGDVCIKPLRQVVTAVGDGAIAATELEKVVNKAHEELGYVPSRPERVLAAQKAQAQAQAEAASSKDSAAGASQASSQSGFLDADLKAQIASLGARFEKKLVLKAYLSSRDSKISVELKQAVEELSQATDKLEAEIVAASDKLDLRPEKERPCLEVLCAQTGEKTGVVFHGVPGGHEFQSFVVGLYNAAGPGQKLAPELETKVKELGSHKLQILVSLSCTQCPDLVIAAQRMATLNKNIDLEVFDLRLFPELKERYEVASVPCLVFDGGAKVDFGKKNVEQLVELFSAL